MSKAYQDGGKWWVPWTGEIVPEGAEYLLEVQGWKPEWNQSLCVGENPQEDTQYRIPATQDEIDAALRAEAEAYIAERPGLAVALGCDPSTGRKIEPSAALNGWIEKSWGRTRQVFAAEGVEVWESDGKAGHRTSWHSHPHHSQTVIPISGDVIVNDGELRANAESWPEVDANEAHDVRFETDCRFLEHYQRVTGTGSVMDTLEEIFR